MERYIIVERYADNGELSHRALVDSTDGRELGTDGGEPEDQSLWRDWAWVPDELNKAQATVEALQRERDEAIERAEQCRKDRAMVLTVKTTDGLTVSEWLMWTAVAEQKAKDLQAALDAEREKAKGLEGQYQRAYGRAANAEQAVTELKTELSQLQSLVREVESELAGIVRRNQGGYIKDREAIDKCLALIRTPPATPTERGHE